MSVGIYFALGCAVLAIIYGFWQATRIVSLPDGNERMREIAAAIREGAIAYLWRQYRTIAIVGVILFFVIGFIPALGWATARTSSLALVCWLRACLPHRWEPFPVRWSCRGSSAAGYRCSCAGRSRWRPRSWSLRLD